MNQSRRPLTWYQGIKIGLRPQVGHFKRAALAIIQQKRWMGYRGDSLALVTIIKGSLPAERRQRERMSGLGQHTADTHSMPRPLPTLLTVLLTTDYFL